MPKDGIVFAFGPYPGGEKASPPDDRLAGCQSITYVIECTHAKCLDSFQNTLAGNAVYR